MERKEVFTNTLVRVYGPKYAKCRTEVTPVALFATLPDGSVTRLYSRLAHNQYQAICFVGRDEVDWQAMYKEDKLFEKGDLSAEALYNLYTEGDNEQDVS